jgi:bifunctional non-homologous end joining protein LigD
MAARTSALCNARWADAVAKSSTEAILFAFDLLYFDGHDLTKTELSVRRHLLTDLLDGAVGAIQLSEEVQGDGAALLENARSLGLEGIIAKHRDSPTAPAGRETG